MNSFETIFARNTVSSINKETESSIKKYFNCYFDKEEFIIAFSESFDFILNKLDELEILKVANSEINSKENFENEIFKKCCGYHITEINNKLYYIVFHEISPISEHFLSKIYIVE